MWAISDWTGYINAPNFMLFLIFLAIEYHLSNEHRKAQSVPSPIKIPVVGYVPLVIIKKLQEFVLKLMAYADILYHRLGSVKKNFRHLRTRILLKKRGHKKPRSSSTIYKLKSDISAM